MTKQEKWDYRYMGLAQHFSTWSKDPDKKVGAVIVDTHYMIGQGYNGLPRGIEDTNERLQEKSLKLDLTIHAEENALLSCGNKGQTIYVYPCLPCTRCLAKINQTAITRIVSLTIQKTSSWEPELVFELAKEMGIEVTLLTGFYSYLAQPDYFCDH